MLAPKKRLSQGGLHRRKRSNSRHLGAFSPTAAATPGPVCEVLLSEGVQAYKKEGPKFLQRLVTKQKAAMQD